MPYIHPVSRAALLPISEEPAHTPGALNYQITCLIRDYVNRRGLNYTILNEVTGALECAKLEFNRRVVAPYENKKIQENGDVYLKGMIE